MLEVHAGNCQVLIDVVCLSCGEHVWKTKHVLCKHVSRKDKDKGSHSI